MSDETEPPESDDPEIPAPPQETEPVHGPAGRLVPVHIERELSRSYLRYSMSVIVARALPDVRDGLKPVHRRVLFTMDELSLAPDKPYKKSARIVGDVIGKYHPHGDTAVYDTLVRMAQDFSLRYPLVDGQGNFGSVDGDSPAAMRYTEARMARPAIWILRDLDRETVDFASNYDDSLQEPTVLPCALPNLLVNGTTGIAVGMATNMPPHNLREVSAAIDAWLLDPKISEDDLCSHVMGPDFPTGGIIQGRRGIQDALRTGRGRVVVRGRHHIETIGNRQAIIFTEIPYMVNKARLLERTADLVREKIVEGIADLRDESDRDGMRIVIEVKRDAFPDVVASHLFKHADFQTVFSIHNLALVDGQPRILSLRGLIQHFCEHRMDVVERRTRFDLRKARERAHILEGYLLVLRSRDVLDEVIRIIRGSVDAEEAREALMARFQLSEIQARAILDLTLRRLTGLEREKIEREHAELVVRIADLEDILARHERRVAIVREETAAVAAELGDDRRTAIVETDGDVSLEDLVPDEANVVTLSHGGYAKRQLLSEYRAQGRGGKGVTGAGLQDDDFADQVFVATGHAYLLCFTDLGRCYWLRVWDLPEVQRTGKGKHLRNLIEALREGERVLSVVPIRGFGGEARIVFATRRGQINRIRLSAFRNIRRDGIIGIAIDEGDHLVGSLLVEGEGVDLMLATRKGKAIRFPFEAFRDLGRGTRGVRGINLEVDDEVVGLLRADEDAMILTVTSRGFGKRTHSSEYRRTDRGGKGIINLRTSDRTGDASAVLPVRPGDGLMVLTRQGMMIRTSADQIREVGRDSQGVMVMRLADDDEVIDVAHVVADEPEELLEAVGGAVEEMGEDSLISTESDPESKDEGETPQVKDATD